MRLFEFDNSADDSTDANLLTALALIKNRYEHAGKLPKISTQSLINIVLNTDQNFNYDALVTANEKNPAVKNLIKSFNRQYVELTSDSESDIPTTNVAAGQKTGSPDTVSDMAHRAAKQRGTAT